MQDEPSDSATNRNRFDADRGIPERIPGRLLFACTKEWGDVSVARYRFPPGERKVPAFPGHVLRLHRSDPHFLIQRIDGRTRAQTETRDLITVIPTGMPLEQVFQAESDDYNVLLQDDVVRKAAEQSEIDPDRLEVRDHPFAEDPYVLHLGLALGAELEGDSVGEALYAEALGYALAVHLVRKYSALRPEHRYALELAASQTLSRQVLDRVMEYIEANLDARLTLADIARAGNLSPFHFSRLFRASLGVSPHQYVIQRRTERARELLETTRLPIPEIAWETGFADQSHLGRNIRRRYGVTPRMLRDAT